MIKALLVNFVISFENIVLISGDPLPKYPFGGVPILAAGGTGAGRGS